MRNFKTFHQNTWKCQNWDYDRILLSKVENAWTKKLQNGKKFDEELTVSNWPKEFDEYWLEHSKVPKSCTLMGCFWPKYRIFEVNKYRIVMFDGAKYQCKIWRKSDLCFQKWHEEFGKFSPGHLKVSKLGLWWGPLRQSTKYMSLKCAGGLRVMKMKNDAKFEEELPCQFKTDMKNLKNFDRSNQKSQKFAF